MNANESSRKNLIDVIINDVHVFVEAGNVDYAIATAEALLIETKVLGKRGISELGVTVEMRRF